MFSIFSYIIFNNKINMKKGKKVQSPEEILAILKAFKNFIGKPHSMSP